jgi:DNA-binding IclR family transcriptional regulator
MDTSKAKPNGYRAPAVQKAFRILKLVSASNKGLSLSDIAKTLGYGKSTAFGLIQALLEDGLLNQDPGTKKIFLGPTPVELSLRSWNYLKINKKAQPLLDDLRDITGESVFLGARSNDRALIIATSDTKKPLKISAPPGESIPLLAGAVGKIFLSLLDDRRIIELIRTQGLPRFTSHTITEEAAYLAEIEKVRLQGYALDKEEFMSGVWGVAAGLKNFRGLPMGIWVVGFASAMDEDLIKCIAEKIVPISRKLRDILDGNFKTSDS